MNMELIHLLNWIFSIAAEKNQSTKPTNIVCADCKGSGAKQCSQCKGTGVNSVDHFNGQFKAGGLCWLCSCRNWHILGSKKSTEVIQGYRKW
ncbi:hypothetical protein ES319_A10G064900v1 [Gossypium barbadense]|uniref:BSD2 cysteine rich domain-containing protein n=1 Tax=Gossypium barbadense TaxID=3634 RepID=A0A5J5U0Y3_GOSBA|nr:hypothetical protein ES319_A10G064900v1 [Gossypium barbadense]